MSLQFGESPDSRGGAGGTSGTETRKYFCYGTTDRDTVEALAIAGSPSFVTTLSGTLYRQPMTIEPNGPHWTITVPYGKQERESGSYTISFDTSGGTVVMKASLEVIGCYDETGSIAAVDGVSIDVDDEGVPQGTEVIIPALKLNVAFRHPAATITEDRIRTLARNTGKVNSDMILGFYPGEVLFAGATGSESEAEAEVSYALMCSENVDNLVIGNITIAEKQGWDYASVKFKKAAVGGKDATIPESVTVHRLYRRAALATVLGFGGA